MIVLVYLTSYNKLCQTPRGAIILCLEPRSDKKFTCFSPLTVSSLVRTFIKRRREDHALREMSRMAQEGVRKSQLEDLRSGQGDVVFVSWETPDSAISRVRRSLLDRWKIHYEVL